MELERLAITSNPANKADAIKALEQLSSVWRLPTKDELFLLTHSIGSYWVSDTKHPGDAYSISIMWGGPIMYGSLIGQVLLLRDTNE
jgi:hypothetical protein